LPDKTLPFATREMIIDIPGSPSKYTSWRFSLPSNPDAVLDTITDEQFDKDQFLPYWVEHWPSAQILFRYLHDTPLHSYKHSCEIGCGLGIISSLLASNGLDVVSTDISLPACQFAAENIRGNAGIPRVLCSDWRHLPFKTTFDLVVGSDILYEKRWIAPVVEAIDTILSSDGTVLVADPCRVHWEPFKDYAMNHGFSCGIIHSEHYESTNMVIEIAALRRRNHKKR